jgi:thioester reductase-like protein
VLTERSNVFVTGATGLIGGELVRTLISERIGKVWALVRVIHDASPTSRLAHRLRRSGASLPAGAAESVHAVAGDVSMPRLGLDDEDYEEVRRGADIIIHSAAETSFIRAADCRRTNIAGAENLIEFARACPRQPLLVCLSTAYVSGVVANACISEEDAFQSGSEHHNEYTRSKAVAEELVRSSGLPVLVVRPSIVLSAGLPDPTFARAILGFSPLLKELDAIPVNPRARADIVPVQFVVDGIIRLLRLPRLRYDCYHVSGGTAATEHGRMSPIIDRFYDRPVPLRMIAPAEWTRETQRKYVHTPKQRKAFASLRNYLPFINMNVLYDNSRLRQELGDRFPPLPPFSAYLEELLGLISSGRHALRLLHAARAPQARVVGV